MGMLYQELSASQLFFDRIPLFFKIAVLTMVFHEMFKT